MLSTYNNNNILLSFWKYTDSDMASIAKNLVQVRIHSSEVYSHKTTPP